MIDALIHPEARARGVTIDHIAVGMKCTVYLGGWAEGPAEITKIKKTSARGGGVVQVEVRAEFVPKETLWPFHLGGPRISDGKCLGEPRVFRHYVRDIKWKPDRVAFFWNHRTLSLGHVSHRDARLDNVVREVFEEEMLRSSTQYPGTGQDFQNAWGMHALIESGPLSDRWRQAAADSSVTLAILRRRGIEAWRPSPPDSPPSR